MTPIRHTTKLWKTAHAVPARRVQLAPPARLLHGPTRSGDAIEEWRTLRCSLSPRGSLPVRRRGRGAEPAGAVIRRPAGHNPAFVDRGKVRARRRRVTARRAPHLARRGQSLGQAGLDPGPRTGRHSIHTGRRSHERTAPTPETDHRASPSRNGSPAHRLWWRGWHARRCIVSPAGRALSRKPFQPPDAAPPIRGRATMSGGTPEFSTE
jgi:hypothetical protein